MGQGEAANTNMFDATIHLETLNRHVSKSDFRKYPYMSKDWYRADVLTDASAIGRSGFSSLAITSNVLRGKPVYKLESLSQELVLRLVGTNIRRVTNVKQDDRQLIIRCIRSLCMEGMSFRVYKFDIKSFYESVNSSLVIDRLSQDVMFSGQSTRVVTSFFACLSRSGIHGLPRGMGISATLAEYLLRGFDQSVHALGAVLFMARYVDDIFIITSGREESAEFRKTVEGLLPSGLFFNEKSAIYSFSEFARGTKNATTEGKIDFLGYQLDISRIYQDSGPLKRRVLIDISPKKVRRFKTRVSLALLDYKHNRDFYLLLSRVKLLTSNFSYVDEKTERRRLSGIYFNYPMVDAEQSSALDELDKYLISSVTCRHRSNKLYPALSNRQVNMLVRLSFRTGFEKKRFFSFEPSQLMRLTECWTHA